MENPSVRASRRALWRLIRFSGADLRISGLHLTVGRRMMSFSEEMALEGNFSEILTEDWR